MFDKYTIKPNDNLQDIAKKFNVLPDVLLDINNIYFPDELRVGMEIIVPKNKEQYFNYYTIESGDYLYKISQKYNISSQRISVLLRVFGLTTPNKRHCLSETELNLRMPKLIEQGATISKMSESFISHSYVV